MTVFVPWARAQRASEARRGAAGAWAAPNPPKYTYITGHRKDGGLRFARWQLYSLGQKNVSGIHIPQQRALSEAHAVGCMAKVQLLMRDAMWTGLAARRPKWPLNRSARAAVASQAKGDVYTRASEHALYSGHDCLAHYPMAHSTGKEA